jgi:hypothetical protein
MNLESIVDAAKSVVTGVAPETSDPAAGRADVLHDLHLAEKAWATDGVHTGAWFARDGEYVAFTPTMRNGAPLTIGGLTTNFVPADRFADYLENMRASIEAGEFDAEIAAGLHGSPNVSGLADVALPPARSGSPDEIRQAQQDEALRREGRNPDGSIETVVGNAPR